MRTPNGSMLFGGILLPEKLRIGYSMLYQLNVSRSASHPNKSHHSEAIDHVQLLRISQ